MNKLIFIFLVLIACELAASEPSHWAFVPLRTVPIPRGNPSNARGGIDVFIDSALAKVGLHVSDAADPATLVRRLHFDLLGLPPEPADVAAFLADQNPSAYERLVDRLLASPHFGERWARHWLDEAGYADVVGTDNDAAIIRELENRWLYRDYVVQSINSDKPFDRFLVEQLAGDELTDWRSAESYSPAMRERLVATGFLRASADDTFERELNLPPARHAVLERTIEIVASNLFALSLGCAKCHDHKYEPLTQRDYYGFKAIFQPAFNPDDWRQPSERQIPAVSAAEKRAIERANAKLDEQILALEQRLQAVRWPHALRLADQKLAKLPEQIQADTKLALETKAEQRTEVQKYLVAKFEPALRVDPAEVSAVLSTDEQATVSATEREIESCKRARQSWAHWQAIVDVGPPTPTRVLERGNPLLPRDEVAPAIFAILRPGSADSFSLPSPNAGTSGRRFALASSIITPNSPVGSLVLRVRVNRIWQRLFGKGLVETSDNFGITGATPTHRELLDWLANDFVAQGQQLKPFLRRIVLSNVYRQASMADWKQAHEIDPDNKLLWHQRLRRIESESIRDSILAVSGRLDRKIGGPPVPVDPKPDGMFVERERPGVEDATSYRRTLYLLARRNYHPTLLATFDQPNLTMNCVARPTSAVVLQSLAMLNDRFVLQQAGALAQRVVAERSVDDTVMDVAFRITLGRSPSRDELAACNAAMQREIAWRLSVDATCPLDEAHRHALTSVCHMLLNTSEFLYVR